MLVAKTLQREPAFRAVFRQQRCVIVTNGFYESKQMVGQKQRSDIYRSDNQLTDLVALWEAWSLPALESPKAICICTIMVTAHSTNGRERH